MSSSAGSTNERKLRQAQRICRTLEELGPLYIKVGQILATRPDFVPQHVRDELERLNDQVAVRPYTHFETILEEDLGADWRLDFQYIQDDEPLGSASLAQVYKAMTREGKPCVIKIQRPGARQSVTDDMRVLRAVGRSISALAPRFNEVVDVPAMIAILFKAMEDELDFTREAQNMKDARKAAREFKHVSVPKVLRATPRVLVQSLAEGTPINRLKPGYLSRKKSKKVSYELMEFMFRGYFLERIFHADPHPGNIIVSPDGVAHIIDWGMVGRIDRNTSAALLGCFMALAQNNGEALARQWVRLGTATPWNNTNAFIQDVSRLIPHWTDATLAELNFGVALMSLLRYSSRRGIQITPVVSVAGKSIANIEGSIRFLNPDLKLSTALRKSMRGILPELLSREITPLLAADIGLSALHSLHNAPMQVQAALADLAGHQTTMQMRTNLGDPIDSGPRHRGTPPHRISPMTGLFLLAWRATRKKGASDHPN
ncbi:ABC1 kinase family protein [Streptomyces buecherae]|uniref:ABC1 kinase family protein n=1 Tax=Streptomyces buecherae TaxID=2763006 RepID=UPI003662E0F4